MGKQTGNVAKGAAFLYVESIVSMLSGYIFWLLISKFTTPQTIGASSAVVSLSAIFSILAGLGVQTGVVRFLGKSFSSNKMGDARLYIISSLIITVLGIVVFTTVIFLSFNWLSLAFKIDSNLLIVLTLLMASTTIMSLLRAIVVSSLETRILPLIMMIFSVVKIIIAISLVLVNLGALGVLIGFTSFPFFASILLSMSTIKILAQNSFRSNIPITKATKEILESSVVTWIPVSVYTLGLHLGPLVIIGSHGAIEAGIYFIAFSIVTAITASMSALFSIAYPKLSAMYDGRKRFAWRTLKISLVLIIPFSTAIMFYSADVLRLFGHAYVMGANSLEILLASMVPVALVGGINTLVYAYGNYRHVLLIGLASNVPRAILYLLLVPIYQNEGAAISYSVGSVIGLIACIPICRKVSFKIFWKDVILISLIPLLFAITFSYLHLWYIAGITFTVVGSYLVLISRGILSKQDLKDLSVVLPSRVTEVISQLWRRTHGTKH